MAIAYGYNNVGLSVPATVTVGKELPLNQLVELLRVECAMCGFTEILTWALCSRQENFGYLRRQDDGNTAVSIGNPATAEFEVCRTSLLQGESACKPALDKCLIQWRHAHVLLGGRYSAWQLSCKQIVRGGWMTCLPSSAGTAFAVDIRKH